MRYIAEGEVRHLGEKLVVTARLTDTKTLKQTWSARLEYEPATLAARPESVQLQLARRLSREVRAAETQRAAGDPTAPGTLNMVLRGYAAWYADTTVNGPREGRKRFEEALRLDPNSVRALSALSDAYENELEYGPSPDHKLFEQKMDMLTGRAVAICDSSAALADGPRSEPCAGFAAADAGEAVSASSPAVAVFAAGVGLLPWALEPAPPVATRRPLLRSRCMLRFFAIEARLFCRNAVGDELIPQAVEVDGSQ